MWKLAMSDSCLIKMYLPTTSINVINIWAHNRDTITSDLTIIQLKSKQHKYPPAQNKGTRCTNTGSTGKKKLKEILETTSDKIYTEVTSISDLYSIWWKKEKIGNTVSLIRCQFELFMTLGGDFINDNWWQVKEKGQWPMEMT